MDQSGSKWFKKRGTPLDFKTFYSLLRNHINDGHDASTFVKELIAMITDVSEEEWGTKKDPSGSVSPVTYRNFSKRGISKRVARTICYRLTPKNFIKNLNSRPQAVLEVLAEDLSSYDSDVTSDNVAEKLADIFVNIIRETAGIITPDALKQQKQLQSSADLKKTYGKYLLQECENHCVMNGCSKSLILSNNFNVSEVYEISRIDKAKEPTINNLVALCPQCFAMYQMDNTKKVTSLLSKRKKVLANHMENLSILSSSQLEEGLTNVICKIAKLNEKDLFDFSLDPKELKEKIDPHKNFHIYMIVKQNVTTYFVKVQEILTNLDKRKVIDYENLQDQMRSIYKKLKKAKRSDTEIFEEISEKLHDLTLQSVSDCQIVVSYFVQKCEVFDGITK